MRWVRRAPLLFAATACMAVTGPARAESPRHYLGAAPEPRGTKSGIVKPLIPSLPTVPSPLVMAPRVNANVSTTAAVVASIESLDRAFAAAPRGTQARADLALRLQRENTELELLLAAQSKGAITEPARFKLELLIVTARRRIEACGVDISLGYPTYPAIDESLWLRATAYDRAGDRANARKLYYELIQRHPASAFAPDAYLAFGDSFFDEALSDPSKWLLAEKAYEQALQLAVTDARRAYASYRYAHAIWRGGRSERAASELATAVGLANKAGAPDIVSAACRDWVLAWSVRGTPRTALTATVAVAGPLAPTTKTLAMLESLAETWSATGRGADATELYAELIAHLPSDDRECSWRAAATEATLAARAGNKNDMNAALEAQLSAWARYTKTAHPDPEQRACTARTAALVVDTATLWHVEAVGTTTRRGTADRTTMGLAHRWYQRALAEWDANAWATIAWPADGQRWPSRAELQRSLADLSYSEARWADCATTLFELRTAEPEGPLARDALDGELVCGLRTLRVSPAVRSPAGL